MFRRALASARIWSIATPAITPPNRSRRFPPAVVFFFVALRSQLGRPSGTLRRPYHAQYRSAALVPFFVVRQGKIGCATCLSDSEKIARRQSCDAKQQSGVHSLRCITRGTLHKMRWSFRVQRLSPLPIPQARTKTDYRTTRFTHTRFCKC